jgi:uncharacterized membrane protein YfhO
MATKTAQRSKVSSKKIEWDLLWLRLQKWCYKNRWYFLAFALPVIILYIAYAKFGMYPFGDWSVLVLDLNGQYMDYYEGMHDAFRGDGSIFYSWSRNLSGEFMGITGYYLASPFNIIVWILPRTMILGAIYITILVKVGTAAVTFLHFLRKTSDISFIHGVIFSTCYALMAYMVVQTMDPMWLDGIVFLPLIILGVRSLVDHDLKIGYIIPLGIMLIAHFYIGMQICIFVVLYFIYYMVFGTHRFDGKWNKKNASKQAIDILSVCIRFGICSLLAAMFAAFMLIPVYNALKLGKMDFSDPDLTFKAQFKMLDVIPRLLPNSYDTCRPEGMMDIYVGALAVLLLPIFYFNSKISAKVKIGNTFLIAALLFSMYIKPLDMYWHGGQAPNWLPYRYSFVFSFVILTMAAYAFSKLEGISIKSVGGSIAGIMGVLIFLETRDYASQVNYEKSGFDVFKILWMSAALIAIYALLVGFIKKYPKSYTLSIILLAVVSGEMYTNSFNTLNAINVDVAYTRRSNYYDVVNNGRKVVESIEADDNSLWRADKTYQRVLSENMAWGLRGMQHSSSVMNADILILMEKLGYMSNGYRSKYNGGNPLTDSLFGIKYVLNREVDRNRPGSGWRVDPTYTRLPEYTVKYYNADFAPTSAKTKNGESKYSDPDTNDEIGVYKNENALPIGYMVNADIQKIAKFDGMNVFWNNNTFLSTLVGKATGVGTSSPVPVDYYKEIPLDDEPENPVLNNVTFNPTYSHYDQTGGANLDHTFEYHITAPTDDPIYVYFHTLDQKKVNVWFQDEKNQNGEFLQPFKEGGQYFEDENNGIMKVGQYPAGTQVAIRLTVTSSYAEVREAMFYYLDMETMKQDLDILKQNSWQISEWSATHIEGKINANQNQIMLTSIPYEDGWTVKVDGKKVKPVKILSALVGIPMSAGSHTVEMTFAPNGFPIGVLLGIIALGACVFFFIYDRKHNAVWIEKINTKNEYIKSLKMPKKPTVKTTLKKSTNPMEKLKEEIEKNNKE